MDMKKTVCAAIALLALGASAAAFDATERDIVRKAVSAARERLRTASALDGKAVTLLPVKGDDDSGFAGQLLMTALVEAGKTCVISNDEKNDERFKRILQEIKWDERQTTLKSIDPATADELGRLKSTQILLEARFDIVRRGRKQRPVAELGLLAYSVATKQFVWAADVAADAGGRKWPDPSAVSVKVSFAPGEGAEGLAASLGVAVRDAVAAWGYRVDAAGAADLALEFSLERSTFDKTGGWFVFDGAAKARLASVAGDGVLHLKEFSVRGPRGLGEKEADASLSAVMSKDILAWLDATLAPRTFFAKHPDFADAVCD